MNGNISDEKIYELQKSLETGEQLYLWTKKTTVCLHGSDCEVCARELSNQPVTEQKKYLDHIFEAQKRFGE